MNPAHAPAHLPIWKLRHGRVREANFFREQEHRGKNRERMRSVSRIPRAEENGPKDIAPSFATRRTSSGRGNFSFRSIRSRRYSLSSRRKMLNGGRCSLISVCSRRRASFSEEVTMHRTDAVRPSRWGIWGRAGGPDLGPPLEVEPLRRLLHLLAQLPEMSGQLPGGCELPRFLRDDGNVVPLADLPDRPRDVLLHGLRGDAVLPVEHPLLRTAALRLGNGVPHRTRHLVRIQDHLSRNVPRGTSERLDQGAGRPEKSLLIGVQDGHEGYLGNVQPLAEKVDPDEDGERPEAQVPDDVHPLDRVDVGVQVLDPDERVNILRN